jgi:hypothetical protein
MAAALMNLFSAMHFFHAGTYFGVHINRSSGARTRALAEKVRKKLERDIESGVLANENATGFAAAAAAYMKAGGDNRFLLPLIDHFTNTPLDKIDQVAIDNAAAEIYPEASAATRNRQDPDCRRAAPGRDPDAH